MRQSQVIRIFLRESFYVSRQRGTPLKMILMSGVACVGRVKGARDRRTGCVEIYATAEKVKANLKIYFRGKKDKIGLVKDKR